MAIIYLILIDPRRIKDKRIKDKIFYFKSVYNKRETLAQGAIYRQYIAIRSNEYIQTCKWEYTDEYVQGFLKVIKLYNVIKSTVKHQCRT